MSLVTQKIVRCQCGNLITADVYLSVNVTVNPELRAKVLKGGINSGACPRCGKRFQLLTPYVYHDMNRLFWIEVFPKTERKNAGRIKKEVLSGIASSRRGYNLIEVVFGTDELRRLVMKAEEKYRPDDKHKRLIERAK